MLAWGLLASAGLLGAWGSLRPTPWKDGGAVLLLGGAFLGAGLLVADLGLLPLYLFVALGLLTYQLMAFRTTLAPLPPAFASDEEVVAGLRSAFVASLLRSFLMASLVFLLTVMLFVVATGFVIGLSAEATAFLLALAVLAALFLLATRPPSPSS